jgi:hypothetical protein
VPARPSGKCRISAVETFGGGEGKIKSGARRDVELGLTASVRNFELLSVWREGSVRWN